MKLLEQFDYRELPPVLSTDAMRALDAATKEEMARDAGDGSTAVDAGYCLMKQAGAALYRHVVDVLENMDGAPGQGAPRKAVAVFVGGGNNGGDGLVFAKLLIEAGIPCTVYSLAAAEKFKNEAKLALDDFVLAGGRLAAYAPAGTGAHFSLVVDCMLGNGASGELRELYAAAVRDIGDWNVPVVAADAPTGYDSREHLRREPCINAVETVLFGFPRLDAYIREGGKFFGRPIVAPLAYPDSLVCKFDEKIYLATESLIPQLLPKRDEWGDKREQGCAMIVAGSGNMPGAAVLCTRAALRSGVGLVTLASPEAVMPVLQAKLSEPVFCNLQDMAGQDADSVDDRAMALAPAHIPQILEKAKHCQALAIGPGLSGAECTRDAVLELLPQIKCPMVIDADALNAIASLNKTVASTTSGAASFLRGITILGVLTPHRRECERLFGPLPASSIDFPAHLRNIAQITNKVLLLKGAPTFVAIPDGRVYVVPACNSGLAKGGSGDVLTGIIVALLSQGLAPLEAAVLGALLHQKAGKITRDELGPYSMLPGDIVKKISRAFVVP
ncbi:NAD(P)H-hydrate dehydratase [uncultured Fibrobacter sp.]|uniref:NAD(P)H-hydrate dehydratase n=1 Tax=uncultured Fibrobacter sp. TaxID=261512 RepID=UPI00260AC185|nr:NAD(P)H-hydrate dehydratase [uncultured Fibrobacter sp.]